MLFTILPNIHPFMHMHNHTLMAESTTQGDSQLGAVRVRRLAQGHLDTHLGGAGD